MFLDMKILDKVSRLSSPIYLRYNEDKAWAQSGEVTVPLTEETEKYIPEGDYYTATFKPTELKKMAKAAKVIPVTEFLVGGSGRVSRFKDFPGVLDAQDTPYRQTYQSYNPAFSVPLNKMISSSEADWIAKAIDPKTAFAAKPLNVMEMYDDGYCGTDKCRIHTHGIIGKQNKGTIPLAAVKAMKTFSEDIMVHDGYLPEEGSDCTYGEGESFSFLYRNSEQPPALKTLAGKAFGSKIKMSVPAKDLLTAVKKVVSTQPKDEFVALLVKDGKLLVGGKFTGTEACSVDQDDMAAPLPFNPQFLIDALYTQKGDVTVCFNDPVDGPVGIVLAGGRSAVIMPAITTEKAKKGIKGFKWN